MKNIFLLIFYVFFLCSCSDKLTNSEAEAIAKKCLEKTPNKRTTLLILGDNCVFNSDSMKYKKLATDGYLSIEKNPKQKYQYRDHYSVSLTEKAKPFVEETNDRSALVKTCDLTMEKVAEVVEIPAIGGAKVKIQYENTNKTPFYILDKQSSSFEIKTEIFSKASDGWKWCNEY